MYCPHCQRPLPDPPERFCPHCGGDVQGAAQAAGAERPVSSPGTPWESRDRLGLVNAYVETTKQVLLSPTAFFRAMPVAGGIGAPLAFGVLTAYIGAVVSALYQMVLNSVMGSWASQFTQGGEAFERLIPILTQGAGLLMTLILGPLFALAGIFVGAAITHLFLMMFSGAGRGFEATLRTVSYCQATQLLQILPLCGGIVASVWGIVVLIIGLSEAHGVSRGTAAAAVLVPLLLVCCCCVGGAFLFFGGIASLAHHLQ
jgi:hypothetical protein